MPERDFEKELRALMDALAESVAGATDEAIVEEARKAGDDVEGIAERLRARLLQAVGEYRQRRLTAARAEYEGAVAAMHRRTVRLPGTPEKRRALLDAVLANNPTLGSLVTAQHRDLSGLPDADVQACLSYLQALGALEGLLDSADES